MIDAFREQVMTLPDQFTHRPSPRGSLPPDGRIIIAGLGGSGLAGEFLGLGLVGARETQVVRDLKLPEVREDDVLLAISYSGNTRETLSVWHEAGERGMVRAAVASGGRLLEEARRDDLPHVEVTGGMAPRSGLGYLLRGCWSLVAGCSEPDWDDVGSHLRKLVTRWISSSETPGPIDDLVSNLRQGLPVFLAWDPESRLAGRRWVADLAENAKVPSAVWEFPESAHNAIMTLAREAPKHHPVAGFILGEPRDAPAREYFRTVISLLEEHGARTLLVEEPHEIPWIQALGLAHLGDWASVLLAESLEVDASSLSLMDELKERLARKEKGNA
jgi:glucose/mannose-6-phosphate isomerase